MYYTYVLKSEVADTLYKGYTHNLEKRVGQHNNGLVNFTSKYKPWRLVYFEVFATKTEAILRERFFKSGKGREWLKNKLANINLALVSDYGSSASGGQV